MCVLWFPDLFISCSLALRKSRVTLHFKASYYSCTVFWVFFDIHVPICYFSINTFNDVWNYLTTPLLSPNLHPKIMLLIICKGTVFAIVIAKVVVVVVVVVLVMAMMMAMKIVKTVVVNFIYEDKWLSSNNIIVYSAVVYVYSVIHWNDRIYAHRPGESKRALVYACLSVSVCVCVRVSVNIFRRSPRRNAWADFHEIWHTI